MAIAATEFRNSHATGIEQSLAGIAKHLGLGLNVQVEVMVSPILMNTSSDFVFTISSTLNELEVEHECEMPFRIRLKALLQALATGLPGAYPTCEWEVPVELAKHADPKLRLSVENIESRAAYALTMHRLRLEARDMVSRVRFRIRATETLEARQARK